jgi:hypothetical protein
MVLLACLVEGESVPQVQVDTVTHRFVDGGIDLLDDQCFGPERWPGQQGGGAARSICVSSSMPPACQSRQDARQFGSWSAGNLTRRWLGSAGKKNAPMGAFS